MSKLPIFRRVLHEDVPGASDWFDRFLISFNSFAESIYTALSGNLTFVDNVRAQIREFTFTTLATYSSGSFDSLNFSNTLKTKATGLFIMQMFRVEDNFLPLCFSPFINWLDVNGEIQILYINGLNNSTKYFLRVMVV